MTKNAFRLCAALLLMLSLAAVGTDPFKARIDEILALETLGDVSQYILNHEQNQCNAFFYAMFAAGYGYRTTEIKMNHEITNHLNKVVYPLPHQKSRP